MEHANRHAGAAEYMRLWNFVFEVRSRIRVLSQPTRFIASLVLDRRSTSADSVSRLGHTRRER
jgi:hypothetical protein